METIPSNYVSVGAGLHVKVCVDKSMYSLIRGGVDGEQYLMPSNTEAVGYDFLDQVYELVKELQGRPDGNDRWINDCEILMQALRRMAAYY